MTPDPDLDWTHSHTALTTVIEDGVIVEVDGPLLEHSHFYGYRSHKHRLTTEGDNFSFIEHYSEAFDCKIEGKAAYMAKTAGIHPNQAEISDYIDPSVAN